jgi:endoglucanase
MAKMLFACAALLAWSACSPTSPSAGPASGGAAASGGNPGSDGGAASGGLPAGAGGSGGSGATGAGGLTAAGGDSGSGGGLTTGGSNAGSGGDASVVDAAEMAQDMGLGTNIGNTLENTTTWETGWGQPLITEQFIGGLASRGIKTVRVPVAWDTYASDGVIDAAKAARVKEVVSWILDAGMYAIVNIHWDGGWIFSEGLAEEYTLPEAVKLEFASYWQQIGRTLGDLGHHLLLEGLNEEARFYVGGDSSGQPDYAALNELNQLFVTTVRGLGGYNATRALLIAGFVTDITLTCVAEFAIPSDPAGPGKLFLSLHYYTPYTFCGLDAVESWGSPATTWGTPAEQAELQVLFDTAGSFSQARSLPIILGEFAVTPGNAYPREPASRVLWMTAVAEAALARDMVAVLWDTGSEISRVDGAFSPEFQQVMDNLAAP